MSKTYLSVICSFLVFGSLIAEAAFTVQPPYLLGGNVSIGQSLSTLSAPMWPGARMGSASALNSISGSLYLFGGNGWAGVPSSISNTLNDLWGYSIKNMKWSFLSASTITGRNRAMAIVNAQTNTFLVFGGMGITGKAFNEVWEFQFDNSTWTFLCGGSTSTSNQNTYGNYGTKNVQSPSNIIPVRFMGAVVAHPVTGSMIIYGGQGDTTFPGGTSYFLGDMWSFNRSAVQWTYLGGCQTTSSNNQCSRIIISNVSENALNLPGSRTGGSFQSGPQPDAVYLVGGSIGTNSDMDVWRFNLTSNLWIIINNVPYSNLVIGGIQPENNYGSSTAFIPAINSFMMFGGRNSFSDKLWIFNMSGKEWSRIIVASPLAPRERALMFPIINASSFTIFGGTNNSDFTGNVANAWNDLWLFNFSSSSPTTAQTLSNLTTSTLYSSVVLPTTSYVPSLSSVVTITVISSLPSSVKTFMTSVESTLAFVSTEVFVPATPASPAGKSSNASVPVYLNPVLIIAAGLICMIVIVITSYACMRRRSKSKSNVSKNATTTVTVDFGTNYSLTSQLDEPSYFTQGQTVSHSATRTNFSVMSQTMTGGQTEFAVPAFRQMQSGKDFKYSKIMASGPLSTVFYGEAKNADLAKYGKTIAVKRIASSRAEIGIKQSALVDQEIAVMQFLTRYEDRFVQLLGYSEQPLCMLMKYYPLGSLFSQIQKLQAENTVMPVATQVSFCLDIARAMQVMFEKQIAHCDIKPGNVLLDQKADGTISCILTDFGMAQIYNTQASLVHEFKVVQLRGASMAYASPEAMIRLKFNITPQSFNELVQSDVYSYSVIIYQVLTVVTRIWNY